MSLWIKSASTDLLLDLSDEVHGLLFSIVTKKGDTYKATAQMERRLFMMTAQAWKQAAAEALRASSKYLAGKPTKTKINRFIKAMGVKLDKPLTPAQQKEVGARITQIWRKAKQIAAKEVKTGFQFGSVDARAVKAIQNHHVFWIGNFFDDHLSERIAAVAEDGLITRGLSQQEVGQALRQELLTGKGKTKLAKEIPARYAGNPDLYFRQVASNAAHQARTFSRVVTFGSARIRRYRLINPMDRRTGQICQHMAGQTFTVAQGTAAMNRVLGASTPADIKNAAPWLAPAAIQSALQGTRTGSPQATSALVGAKTELPPFHPLCRTEPVAIS